jgi:hypothetical protein
LPQDGQDSMMVKTARLLKRAFHIDLDSRSGACGQGPINITQANAS